MANAKIYVNREEGFIGTGLKKDEFVADCSDLDDIIAFTKAGIMKVVKVADKAFIGKDILHVAVFHKGDERTTYNMIYTDGKSGVSFAKRFNVTGITRDKEYLLTKGEEKSRVQYLSANPNGEAEMVRVLLSPQARARSKEFDFGFDQLEIKGRGGIGKQLTKYPIRSIRFKEAGKATLSGRQLWFDDTFGRLNTEEKGQLLGSFAPEDRILVIYQDGNYEITDQELSRHFDSEKIQLIEKFDPGRIITAVYLDQEKKQYNIKRFQVETTTLNSKFFFIKEGEGNRLEAVTTDEQPILIVKSGRGAQARRIRWKVTKVVELMGWRAVGVKMVDYNKTVEMEWDKKGGEKRQPELFE